jgi:sulfate adenylyltransferase
MLIEPYKGRLIDLLSDSGESPATVEYASSRPSISLTPRQTCDLELLATGAFSPVDRFMSERDFNAVINDMRLADGTVFPIPMTLSVDRLEGVEPGGEVLLRDQKNQPLALMTVSEIYEWDRTIFAEKVLGTADLRHPLVAELQTWGRFNLSGPLKVIKLPQYHDFSDLRLTPRQTRTRLEEMGRKDVVAFQTRNPLHRVHEALIDRAMQETEGTLLLHPTVGMARPGDIDHFTRVRTYKAVSSIAFPRDRVVLALLPLAMRMAGPREAVWHAIIRRNYGANHMIVGRDHASPGRDATGQPFYSSFAAQELAQEMSDEVGVKILPFDEFVYVPSEGRYEEASKVPAGRSYVSVSGTKIRDDFLSRGRDLPSWLTRPEVGKILSERHAPWHQRGVCLWFTGLSGAGKSSTAEIVVTKLLEEGRRSTLLDGDVVRTHLSKGLGFSREDRITNVRRIGFVASEIVRHGGVAICAAISPYKESRAEVRQMFEEGSFVEVFVDTSLQVCEQRDTKGLYAMARSGKLTNFTGISDDYEPPDAAELVLRTEVVTALGNALGIVEFLRARGFLRPLIAAHPGDIQKSGNRWTVQPVG